LYESCLSFNEKFDFYILSVLFVFPILSSFAGSEVRFGMYHCSMLPSHLLGSRNDFSPGQGLSFSLSVLALASQIQLNFSFAVPVSVLLHADLIPCPSQGFCFAAGFPAVALDSSLYRSSCCVWCREVWDTHRFSSTTVGQVQASDLIFSL
jgi:hypothetical protein